MQVVPEQLAAVARLAEAGGFDSVWVNDHVVVPAAIGSPYPFSADGVVTGLTESSPYADPLATLAYVAALTTRVRLGVSILVLPYKHPLVTAKLAATVDVLSGGRLILGVGSGWLREEFDALGVDFDTRMRAFDEQLEILQAAWTQPVVSYEGQVYSFAPVGLEPRPVRPGGIPLWIGGHSRSTLKRACRFGEALHWVAPDVAEVRRRVGELADVAAEAGLEQPPPVTLRGRLQLAAEPEPFATGAIVGPPSYLVETLGEYEQAGVSHFMIDNRKGGYDAMVGSLEDLSGVLDQLDPERSDP
jgi:probable F420-dependent oxidoreductase